MVSPGNHLILRLRPPSAACACYYSHVGFNVTESPGATWTAQQIAEAFPWDTAPRYLLRDRDGVYGQQFTGRVDHMGIKEVKIVPRSPWQNPFEARLVGTLRRDCIDHVIVLGENHLRRILRDYVVYYHNCRTHLSLEKDGSPTKRRVGLLRGFLCLPVTLGHRPCSY